jgi:hypothetical protein
MDPVLGGKRPSPTGYVSYLNSSGQTIDAFTGRTLSQADPLWHWAFSSL